MSAFHQFSPEDIELLPYPAYFMNEERLIIKRNKNAAPSRIAIHVRAKIDKYISRQDRKRIEEMAIGEEIFVDLFYEPAYGAIICRIEHGYLVAIRNITAHMMQYVSQIAQNIPSFFGNVMGQIDNLRLATYQSREEMTKVRKQYYKVMRYQTCLAHYFSSTAGKYNRDSVCEITTPMLNLLNEAASKLRPNGVVLITNAKEANTYIHASADDVRYAAATLLSIAAENTYDGRIRAESITVDEDYLIKFIFEPRVDATTYQGLIDGYYSGELLASTHGNVFFDLLLIQMLAEGNGWKFVVSEEGCSRGVIGMSIYIPIAYGGYNFLNCPPDSLPLLEMMLVNVLGPQNDADMSIV